MYCSPVLIGVAINQPTATYYCYLLLLPSTATYYCYQLLSFLTCTCTSQSTHYSRLQHLLIGVPINVNTTIYTAVLSVVEPLNLPSTTYYHLQRCQTTIYCYLYL